MSDMVHYKGTLTIVEKLEGETLEEQCKRILGSVELKKYCKSYVEMLLGESYRQYIIYQNDLYEVFNITDIDPHDSIFIAHKIDDKLINYEVRYYNGGCDFNEAIETALENMYKNKI